MHFVVSLHSVCIMCECNNMISAYFLIFAPILYDGACFRCMVLYSGLAKGIPYNHVQTFIHKVSKQKDKIIRFMISAEPFFKTKFVVCCCVKKYP